MVDMKLVCGSVRPLAWTDAFVGASQPVDDSMEQVFQMRSATSGQAQKDYITLMCKR